MLMNSEAPGALAIVTKAGHCRNSPSSNFTMYVIYLLVEKLQLELTKKNAPPIISSLTQRSILDFLFYSYKWNS